MSCLFLLSSLQSFSLYPMYVSLCQYASTIHNHQLVSSSFWVDRHTNCSWCRPSLIHTFLCCPVTFCSLLLHYTTTVIINTCYSFLVFKLSCKCLKCIDFFTFIFCFLNNFLFFVSLCLHLSGDDLICHPVKIRTAFLFITVASVFTIDHADQV